MGGGIQAERWGGQMQPSLYQGSAAAGCDTGNAVGRQQLRARPCGSAGSGSPAYNDKRDKVVCCAGNITWINQ
jgi:hypothetical protein